jgi:hypothetical protein
MRFRSRFTDLVDRQLDLFASENRDLLLELEQARESYRRSATDEAEEVFGDYHDRVEWAAEELQRVRDTYAATLDSEVEREYRRAFTRRCRRRFPELADILAAEDRVDEI